MVTGIEGGGGGDGKWGQEKRLHIEQARFLAEEVIPELGELCQGIGKHQNRVERSPSNTPLFHLELQDMRACNQHEMKNDARIFVLTGEAERNNVGPMVVILFLCCLSFLFLQLP